MISKQPKLQRQKRIFKQVMPRAKQMNINIVTWGRWMKQSSRIPNRTNTTLQPSEMLPVNIHKTWTGFKKSDLTSVAGRTRRQTGNARRNPGSAGFRSGRTTSVRFGRNSLARNSTSSSYGSAAGRQEEDVRHTTACTAEARSRGEPSFSFMHYSILNRLSGWVI